MSGDSLRTGRAVGVAEWGRTKAARANLRWTTYWLEHLGSEDPFELMKEVPIERVQRMHGIGPGTVSSLRQGGYRCAADLWNEPSGGVKTPYAKNVGDARTDIIAEWVLRVRAQSVKTGAANERKRFALTHRLAQLEELLATPPSDRLPIEIRGKIKQTPRRLRGWLHRAKGQLVHDATPTNTGATDGQESQRRSNVPRARTTPEERRHRYVRDEDWQALAHAWRKSPELRDLFDDSFTRYEVTARDERRIRESRGGRGRIKRTWGILESFGIAIEVPPTGPSGKRREPVHFTLPSPQRD